MKSRAAEMTAAPLFPGFDGLTLSRREGVASNPTLLRRPTFMSGPLAQPDEERQFELTSA
jgi:hypothetical protein